MPEVFRTPDESFADLPDFDDAPRYADIDGLRVAYVDEGDGSPVWFMHGEPTWSFLWRKVMGPVRAAGHRTIAPDLPGFGRSDKPTDVGWYSYDRHTTIMRSLLIDQLDLSDVTMVVHDWGGPIGLRLAVEHPDRVSRLVILDTGLFTGHQAMSDAWIAFRDFVARTEDLPIDMLVERACARPMAPEVVAAYRAPFPTPESKAGARAFPLMLPTDPGMPGAQAGQAVLDELRANTRPTLGLWADKDPILTFATGERFLAAINGAAPEPVADAGHFLQEDAGAEIGERIAAWLGTVA